MSVILEVCIDSVEGARAAEAGGAERVELCSALCEGGLTPSAGLIAACRRAFSRGLMVLVRPRGGDFLYSEDEVEVMLRDIEAAAGLCADGVVFGCLTREGEVDAAATGRLWAAARRLGLDATFHRAFDMSRDLERSLDALIQLGLPRVLTSGGEPSAVQGAPAIARLHARAGGRIALLAGGGVAPGTTRALLGATGVRELHSSAKRLHASAMTYRRPGMALAAPRPPSDWEWGVADEGVVRQLRQAMAAAVAEGGGGAAADEEDVG